MLCNVRRWVRHLPAWADAVQARGCPLHGCWGFLDGTLVGIARPEFQQRACFSGHKRHHGLKYLSLMSPAGVSAFIWGVLPGSRHDAACFADSNLLHDLAWLHAQHPGPRALTTYGDAAFPHSVHVQKGYQGALARVICGCASAGGSSYAWAPAPACTASRLRPLVVGAWVSPAGRAYNQAMSSQRICVEWGFGRVGALWKFVGSKNKMQMYLMPVASIYYLAWLLADCHCCMYGNQVTSYFGVRAPTVEAYLENSGAEVPL